MKALCSSVAFGLEDTTVFRGCSWLWFAVLQTQAVYKLQARKSALALQQLSVLPHWVPVLMLRQWDAELYLETGELSPPSSWLCVNRLLPFAGLWNVCFRDELSIVFVITVLLSPTTAESVLGLHPAQCWKRPRMCFILQQHAAESWHSGLWLCIFPQFLSVVPPRTIL